MLTLLRSIITTVIALIYPYLVYKGLQQGHVWIALSIIISFYLYQAFKTTNHHDRLLKLTLPLILILGLFYFQALTAKLIPILVQLILLHFFGKTLLKNHGPSLIERFVRLEFTEFPPGITEYCRQITFMWTVFFAFNIINCIALALWAPVSWWAIYTGIGMLLGTGILMVGEYICRPFLFPDLDIPDIKSSAKNMMVNGRKVWEDIHSS